MGHNLNETCKIDIFCTSHRKALFGHFFPPEEHFICLSYSWSNRQVSNSTVFGCYFLMFSFSFVSEIYTIVPLMQSPWCKTNCTMRKLSKFNLPFCKLLTAFFLNLFICLGPFEIFLYLHLCLHDPQIQNQCHLYTKSMCS